VLTNGVVIFQPIISEKKPPNGLRYPLVGGTRQRRFDGTNLKPRKLPENAPTPISRVHAVLGAFGLRKTLELKNTTASFLLT